MDLGLFEKHIKALINQKKTKEQIINEIKEKTGVSLKEEEIQVTKKEVSLNTTSVKKSLLFQKGIKKILEENKFTLK
ncbi:MAG: hypothetical protein JWN37_146 [Candidatus Nomurabacteria bacterium]|nr:hypothetical protein [Candidatus Nomurabacteria bacterium]